MAAVTAAGAALRFIGLGASPLWADEIMSFAAAQLSPAEAARAALTQHSIPPLFFWLCHALMSFFGDSEATLRWTSAAAGTLTIPAVWSLLKDAGATRGGALWGGLLVALNPLHIWFSQEARPYALCTLFAVLAFLYLGRAARGSGRWDALGGAACGLLSTMTHSVGLALIPIVWFWWWMEGRRREAVPALAAASLLVMSPAVVAWLSAGEDAHAPPRPSSLLEVPYTLFSFVGGFSLGPSVRELQTSGAPALWLRPGQVALGGAAVLAVITLCLKAPSRVARAWLAAAAVPLALTLAGSLVSDYPYNVRYTLLSLPLLLGAAALGAERAGRLGGIGIGFLLGVFLLADVQARLDSRYWKEDSRTASSWFLERLPEGSVVGVAPGYMVGAMTHYAATRRPPKGLRFVEVDGPQSVGGLDGLAITREHHVPDPRGLERRFLEWAGPGAASGEAVGFRMLARSARP